MECLRVEGFFMMKDAHSETKSGFFVVVVVGIKLVL